MEKLGIGKDFLNRAQKAQHLRETMNKWGCIKLKSTAKETVTRLKRQSTEWEKNLYQLFIRSGTNIQNLQGTQKAQPPKNQHPSEEIGT
jgi:hypothetical protein